MCKVTKVWNGGIPFEAEVFQYGKGDELQKEISVLHPDMHKERSRLEPIEDNQEIIVGFEYEISISDLSVLTIGMVEQGQELDADVVRQYVAVLMPFNVQELNDDGVYYGINQVSVYL